VTTRPYGHRGEAIALGLYVARGYRVLGRRVRTPAAEVDLVARRGRTLVLVEVKRRRRSSAETRWVEPAQVERLRAAARHLRRSAPWAVAVRIDLVTIDGWRPRITRLE
jgi:putative endonuclease